MPQQKNFKRHISLLGLTFIAVSGVIGSGWLFVSLQASKVAGPAFIASWVIGAFAIFLIALCFAEIASVVPVAGGIARIPHFTHGDITSAAFGWTAWVGYCTQSPLQVITMIRYFGPKLGLGNFDPAHPMITHPKQALAVLVYLIAFVVINLYGVKLLATMNTSLTWIKVGVLIFIACVFFAGNTHLEHFDTFETFAPYGWSSIFAAIPTGGIIFSLIGFRHAIDMAGEVKKPQTTLPIALLLSIVICTSLYIFLQSAFVMTIPPSAVDEGWNNLKMASNLGPLAALAMMLGQSWLIGIIYFGVFAGPFGDGLVATASNARLGYALSENRILPDFFKKLSKHSIPLRALWLNYFIGAFMVLFLPFADVLQLNEAAITLSFGIGPLAVYSLRKQLPDFERKFKLPWVTVISVGAFTIGSLIVYWAGWDTLKYLGWALLSGLFVLFIQKVRRGTLIHETDWKGGLWLLPYCCGMWSISYLGQYGGGLKVIPFGYDILIIFLLCVLCFVLAYKGRLPRKTVEMYMERYRSPEPPDTAPL